MSETVAWDQPCSSMNRGDVIPPQDPTHLQFGISVLESELLAYKVSVVLTVALPVPYPTKSISNLPADRLISILREGSHFHSL